MSDVEAVVSEKDQEPELRDQSDPVSVSLIQPARTNFLHLPPEIRNLVWDRVNGTDEPTLRTVCKLSKWDMEQVHGLQVIINDRAEHLENNLQWLQDVIVRSLKLEYIGTRVRYHDIQLKNPLMLRRLILHICRRDFNESVNVENLTLILNSCHSLLDLKISVCMETISSTHFHAIFSATLGCLGTKAQLKMFCFLATKNKLNDLSPDLADNWSLGGRGFRIMPDPTYQPMFQFPMKLRRIDLMIPILSRREFLDWSAFLETQDRLEDAFLHVGLVSWHFFGTALQNSASTLRRLVLTLAVPETDVYRDQDLSLSYEGDLVIYNGPADEDDNVEVPDTFDWSVLSQARLELLGIVRSNDNGLKIIRTHNLNRVQLSTIHTLFLSAVHLTTDELIDLFIDGVGLIYVSIQNWALVAELNDADFCLRQSLQVWILISVVLQDRSFIKFTLNEKTLRGFKMSTIVSAVKETVASHNKLVYKKSGVIHLED